MLWESAWLAGLQSLFFQLGQPVAQLVGPEFSNHFLIFSYQNLTPLQTGVACIKANEIRVGN